MLSILSLLSFVICLLSIAGQLKRTSNKKLESKLIDDRIYKNEIMLQLGNEIHANSISSILKIAAENHYIHINSSTMIGLRFNYGEIVCFALFSSYMSSSY